MTSPKSGKTMWCTSFIIFEGFMEDWFCQLSSLVKYRLYIWLSLTGTPHMT